MLGSELYIKLSNIGIEGILDGIPRKKMGVERSINGIFERCKGIIGTWKFMSYNVYLCSKIFLEFDWFLWSLSLMWKIDYYLPLKLKYLLHILSGT